MAAAAAGMSGMQSVVDAAYHDSILPCGQTGASDPSGVQLFPGPVVPASDLHAGH